MSSRIVINMDKWLERLFVLFSGILGLGVWNPLVPANINTAQDEGLSIAQIATVFFVFFLFYKNIFVKHKIRFLFRKSIIVFFFILLFSTILSCINGIKLGDLLIFIKLGLCISLCYLVPNIYSTNKNTIYKGLFAYAIVSSVLASLSLLGLLGEVLENHSGRLWLMGENPNSTGTRMALAIFVIIYILITDPFNWKIKRLLLIITIFPMFALLMAGGSRGSLLILFGITFLYILFNHQIRLVYKLTIIFIVAVSSFFMIKNIGTNNDFSIMERMTLIISGDDSGRSLLNKQTMAVYLNHNLIWGCGVKHYSEEMLHIFRQELPCHNLFVYVIAVSGILGTVSFYLYIGGILWRCWAYRKKDSLPLVLCVFMILVASKSGGVLAFLLMWYVWALVITLTENSTNRIYLKSIK